MVASTVNGVFQMKKPKANQNFYEKIPIIYLSKLTICFNITTSTTKCKSLIRDISFKSQLVYFLKTHLQQQKSIFPIKKESRVKARVSL
jgi:hypothetical protein